MNYSKEAIQHLTQFIKGDDAGRAWLQKNNFPELILFYYSILGQKEAVRELIKNKQDEIIAFALAARGDAKAFNWLVENKKFIPAAVVQSIYEKKPARLWLLKHNLNHYLDLADAIKEKFKEDEKGDIFAIFNKFLKHIPTP
jgi:hypothetical protein